MTSIHWGTVVLQQFIPGGSDICSFCENKDNFFKIPLDSNQGKQVLLRYPVERYNHMARGKHANNSSVNFQLTLIPVNQIQTNTFSILLAQLSRCAYTITFRKPYIASLEIWVIGLWTIGLLEGWKSG